MSAEHLASPESLARYQRQMLLPQIGPAGQRRLADASVLLIGCGALGSVIADQLARAGVGHMRICDRDLVEPGNLQRQVLYDESHARQGLPKAVAAAERLGQINSSINVDPQVVDVHAGNIERLASLSPAADLVLDGTDNVEIRYLINDLCVKRSLPWVYGGCVGTVGRVMVIRPGITPCLRCVYPQPPGPGELPTCDTAGVLGPAAAVVGAMQAAAAIRLIVGEEGASKCELLTVDVWSGRFRSISLDDARRGDCLTCGQRRFEMLERFASDTTSLCGRDAVQVRPARNGPPMDPQALAERLSHAGPVERTPFFVRCRLEGGMTMTVFTDGRAIVKGTTDTARARTLYARYVGS
jgi:adenylyltransferase/sulfurtransferase